MSSYSDYLKYRNVPIMLDVPELSFEARQTLTYLEMLSNYAHKRNLDYGKSILLEIERCCRYLNIDESILNEALTELSEMKLVVVSKVGIDGYVMIDLYQSRVIDLLKARKEQSEFMNWDDGLSYSLNPTKTDYYFRESTMYIIDYLEKSIGYKNVIPVIVYCHLDETISDYEVNGRNVLEDFQVKNALDTIVLTPSEDSIYIRFINFFLWLLECIHSYHLSIRGENQC